MFRNRFLLVLTILVFFAGCAPKLPSVLLSGSEFKDPFYEEMPFSMVNDKIIVKAQINGEEKRFLLETGSPNMISESVFLDLNENIISEIRYKDIYGQGKNLVLCEVDRLVLGNTAFTKIPTLVLDDNNPLLVCYGVDGIIGSNMLRNSILHLDKKHGALVVTNDIYRLNVSTESDIAIETHPFTNAPVLYLKINDKAREKVIFDTGVNALLSMTNTHIQSLLNYGVLTEVEDAFGYGKLLPLYGNQGSQPYYRTKVEKATLGYFSLKNIVAESIGAGEEARLGSTFLNHATVTIDYIEKAIYITPNEKRFEVDVAHKRWPITPSYYNGQLRVGLVWNMGLAALKDQQITIFDDEAVSLNFCDWYKSPLRPDGPALNIATKSDGGSIRKSKLFPY